MEPMPLCLTAGVASFHNFCSLRLAYYLATPHIPNSFASIVCTLKPDYRADTAPGYELIVCVKQDNFIRRDILVKPCKMDDMPDRHVRLTKRPELGKTFLLKSCLYLP